MSNHTIQQVDVRCVAVEELTDLETFVVGLAERQDGSGRGLIFQSPLSFDEIDEQDRALGMDTYCISTDEGASHYGGLTDCVLQDNALILRFEAEAAEMLGIAKECNLNLLVNQEDILQLREGLQRIFTSVRTRPTRLIL